MATFNDGVLAAVLGAVLKEAGYEIEIFDNGTVEFNHPDETQVNVIAINPESCSHDLTFTDDEISLLRSLLSLVAKCDAAYALGDKIDDVLGEQSDEAIQRFTIGLDGIGEQAVIEA